MDAKPLFGLSWLTVSILVISCSASSIYAQPKPPNVPKDLDPNIQTLRPGVTLTLVAEQPQLMTPTGLDVADDGRIWLIACHTHFRPEDYPGPEHDEIIVFDPKNQSRHVFYNKTKATMHIVLGPDNWVYLAQRDRILRVKDTDGDGQGDVEENVAVLDTLADYPHNGLSGMAWHPDHGLVFSLGENFGKDWTLTARDGSHVSGRGEGGVFWCTADGKDLRRIARGFWNPFGLLVRDDGEIFAAENDPGSRPPCRLLQVVEGADYGFQWVYGSAPIHPFVAWNGELRGTLGMIHPSGEGPSGIVELGGGVMIPSWSNHCIDFFPLHRQGASYRSERIELVRGSDHFRPVDMAQAPDGSFYITDWVFSSYELHQQGRLWRLTIDPSAADWLQREREPMNDASILAKALREGTAERSPDELYRLIEGNDAYLADAALTALARSLASSKPEDLKSLPENERLWALVALRRIKLEDDRWVRALLDDPSPEIQFECLRWIADAVLVEYRDHVDAILRKPDLDYRLFEAALAASNTLHGNPGAGVTDTNVLVERILSPEVPLQQKAFALRLVPTREPRLTPAVLEAFLASGNDLLVAESVKTLSQQASSDAMQLLSKIVDHADVAEPIRAQAIAGLANSTQAVHQAKLVELCRNEHLVIAREALRALRGKQLTEPHRESLRTMKTDDAISQQLVNAILDPASVKAGRPPLNDVDAWLARLADLNYTPNPESGRRIFFHNQVGQCANCHRYDGRGNVVGPDLTLVAKQATPKGILQSLLEPNRDVAPQFYTTILELDDGTIFSGILLRSSSTEVYRDSVGQERSFQKHEIVRKKESQSSLMPTGIADQLTDHEIADLLAFLTTSP